MKPNLCLTTTLVLCVITGSAAAQITFPDATEQTTAYPGLKGGGYKATISGGAGQGAPGDFATVGGGQRNYAIAAYSTIAGGGPTDPGDVENTNNRAFDQYCTVGGGGGNRAGDGVGTSDDAAYATVSGGYGNEAKNAYTTVGGGSSNRAYGYGATIGGGYGHYIDTPTFWSTVGGGFQNSAYDNWSVVAGGYSCQAGGVCAAVAGGNGSFAGGDYSMVPGGSNSWATGDASLAAGTYARADDNGAFVWADSTDSIISSPGVDTFTARASGGVTFYTKSDLSAGVTVAANGSSWSSVSTRNAKENFKPVDAKDVLDKVAAMPIETWNYKAQDDAIRHIGPMAEDFRAAFGVGDFEDRITSIDADGIALAAIQGLYAAVQEKDAEIEALKARVAALEQAVAAANDSP